jgi:hypothetical protein
MRGSVVRRRESNYTRKRRHSWFLFEYDWLFLMNWITLPLSIKGKEYSTVICKACQQRIK